MEPLGNYKHWLKIDIDYHPYKLVCLYAWLVKFPSAEFTFWRASTWNATILLLLPIWRDLSTYPFPNCLFYSFCKCQSWSSQETDHSVKKLTIVHESKHNYTHGHFFLLSKIYNRVPCPAFYLLWKFPTTTVIQGSAKGLYCHSYPLLGGVCIMYRTPYKPGSNVSFLS